MTYFVRHDPNIKPNWLVYREDNSGSVQFVGAFPSEQIARRYAREGNAK